MLILNKKHFKGIEDISNLNTSYVDIKLGIKGIYLIPIMHLNTSYVDIKRQHVI